MKGMLLGVIINLEIGKYRETENWEKYSIVVCEDTNYGSTIKIQQ